MIDRPKVSAAAQWRWVEGFFFEVFSEGEVGGEDWGRILASLAGNRARLAGVLVLTKGAAPSAGQRFELRKVLDQGPPVPAAILTESPMARVALTALNYFLKDAARPRPFAPSQIDEALAHLMVPRPLWPRCRQALAEMQGDLGRGTAPR